MKSKLTLTNADAGKLQDAWHYATLIISRGDSAFDGDRSYPTGIRGQLLAYDNLVDQLGRMHDNLVEKHLGRMTTTADGFSVLNSDRWQNPATLATMKANARFALVAINAAAAALGIEARTGEKPESA
jgi:hypothetical protein